MFQTLRIVAAIAIAAWVITRAGAGHIWEALLSIHVVWLVAAFALMMAESLLKIRNWQEILSSILQRRVAWSGLWKAFMIGCFLGTALPSSVGTDALRAYYSRSYFGGVMASHAAAIIILNVFNLVIGCAVALVVALWLDSRNALPASMYFLPVVFAGVACVFPTLYILLKWRRDALVVGLRRIRRRRWFKVRHTVRRFIDSMLIFDKSGARPERFLAICLITIAVQGSVWMALGHGLEVELPWAIWVLMVPANAVAAILPLSIAGFGFNQAAHLAILAAFGVPAWNAVVISAILSLFVLVINIGIGGVTFLMSGNASREYIDSPERAPGA